MRNLKQEEENVLWTVPSAAELGPEASGPQASAHRTPPRIPAELHITLRGSPSSTGSQASRYRDRREVEMGVRRESVGKGLL